MARLAQQHLPETGAVNFLEPGVGSGVFFYAVCKALGTARLGSAVGFEVDAVVAAEAERLWGSFGLRVRPEDFVAAAAPVIEDDRAALILCNPPYVRHHHLAAKQKATLMTEKPKGRAGKRTPPPLTTLRKKKVILFGWYGGKFSHLDWLLPLLPKCHHYCEPFAGSAAVLLNRPPAPVETYNDLDGEVVNFFRVCRDQGQELTRLMALTPFSREEFALACTLDPDLPPLEKARRFYVRARQVRTGLAQTATLGRWGNCKNTSRSGMSGIVSRFLGGVEMLPQIAERLLRVQIENRPAADVIRLYDSPETLFYCDPPYIHETRRDAKAYRYEMTDEQHAALADVLNAVKGKVALSNYDCKLMNELYPAPRWKKFTSGPRTNHATKGERVEVLWTNYSPGEKE